jgi:glycosyltransferase involved in cell wall biosynthesis
MAAAMKIVHVIAGAEIGGAETFAQDAILALHDAGAEQQVFTRPWPRAMARYAAAGVAARGARFARGNLLLGRRIRAAARAIGADLVHAWMQRAASLVPAAMPCPVLGWFGDYYNLKYFRSADCFVGVTPDITRHIAAAGMPAERCFTVNTFGTMPEAAPVSRASLATPQDAPLLLVLSRMHRVKGIDTMLHALAEVPGAFLWLAGDGPARVEYEQLAARLGLGDRVRFLGWRNDRKALLEACDLCVLPSRYEPFGTVIAEAWAMRRPLVASLADGARQYVRDGVNGLVCPIDDPPALAACLRRAIGDAALRATLVAGGTAAYQADFTREVVTARLLECYRRVVELGRRR